MKTILKQAACAFVVLSLFVAPLVDSAAGAEKAKQKEKQPVKKTLEKGTGEKEKEKEKQTEKEKENEKVTICHKGHTISVSKNALQAHLNHGDTLGPCDVT